MIVFDLFVYNSLTRVKIYAPKEKSEIGSENKIIVTNPKKEWTNNLKKIP